MTADTALLTRARPAAAPRTAAVHGAAVRAAERFIPRTRTALGAAAGAAAGVYPALLPRSILVEGLVIGLLAAIGVAAAVLVSWLWEWAAARPGAGRGRAGAAALAGCAGAVTAATAWSAQWTRTHPVPGMSVGGGWYWLCAMAIAAATCALALAAVRQCRARPRAVLAALLASTVIGTATGAGIAAPARNGAGSPAAVATALPTRSGGPRSLLDVDSLGEHGRRFVADTAHPGAVRAYAGLDSAPTAAARAAAAADDLVRLGGLAKRAVVVMVPTGSGWIDGGAARGIEELFGGDVAEIGVQYAAAPSWVSYLLHPDEAADATRALLRAVAGRIEGVAPRERPELYVYGESLGAAAGARALTAAPRARAMVCGALWVGPPARFRDPVPARSAVVVNASDPVPHWDPADAVRRPHRGSPGDGDRPPWLPVVSFVQSSVDVGTSRSGPEGTGHVYSPAQAQALPRCRPGPS